MFYSGEFHPWRLPVPGLWLDVLQKIKALGYTGVSTYVDWALLEGSRGRGHIHVTDYDVGGHNLIYSSADIFTHGPTGERRVLVLYGLAGETHELAFPSSLGKPTVVRRGGRRHRQDRDERQRRRRAVGSHP